MEEKLLTLAEVATFLKCGKQTVRRYIKDKKLKAGFFGKSYRIPKTELQKFLTEHSIETTVR